MLKPPFPANEATRLAALRQLDILDTAQEEAYDKLVRFVARHCGVEIALVTLVDAERQWFKAEVGLGVRETCRDVSFCAHAILQEEPFVVADTLADPRFADNPLVTGAPYIRFYAGIPLLSPQGLPLGTLCVIDRQPRELTALQLDILRHGADHIALLLAMRQASLQLERYRSDLERERQEKQEELQLLAQLMTRLMSPERLDASALQYWIHSTETVGGDLVAAARSPHGKYYVLLADSTGHGMPATINLLPITRIFYSLVAKSQPVDLLVEAMNRRIRQVSPIERFVAAILVCFDRGNRTVEVWNGGIPAALYIGEDGQVEYRFDSRNLPLGLDDGRTPPRTVLYQWQKPGQVFFCSDGLYEARNQAGEVLDEGRVHRLLSETPREERFARLQARVLQHLDGLQADDDIAAVLVDMAQLPE